MTQRQRTGKIERICNKILKSDSDNPPGLNTQIRRLERLNLDARTKNFIGNTILGLGV